MCFTSGRRLKAHSEQLNGNRNGKQMEWNGTRSAVSIWEFLEFLASANGRKPEDPEVRLKAICMVRRE